MARFTFDQERHIYRIDGRIVPSVTQVLSNTGIIDTGFYTDQGRERGRAVHAACHYLDEEDLDPARIDHSIAPYVRAYESFKRETGFEPDLIEVPVFNPIYHYAGTPDRTGRFGSGEEVLLDIKSGEIEPWAALQLAGYNECLPRRLARYGLKLKADGSYQLKQFRDPNDRNVFLAAVAVSHWKINNGGKYADESRSAA